ncbi:hypothetical protein GCM10027596_37100 [Nocardioides korecus]
MPGGEDGTRQERSEEEQRLLADGVQGVRRSACGSLGGDLTPLGPGGWTEGGGGEAEQQRQPDPGRRRDVEVRTTGEDEQGHEDRDEGGGVQGEQAVGEPTEQGGRERAAYARPGQDRADAPGGGAGHGGLSEQDARTGRGAGDGCGVARGGGVGRRRDERPSPAWRSWGRP